MQIYWLRWPIDSGLWSEPVIVRKCSKTQMPLPHFICWKWQSEKWKRFVVSCVARGRATWLPLVIYSLNHVVYDIQTSNDIVMTIWLLPEVSHFSMFRHFSSSFRFSHTVVRIGSWASASTQMILIFVCSFNNNNNHSSIRRMKLFGQMSRLIYGREPTQSLECAS